MKVLTKSHSLLVIDIFIRFTLPDMETCCCLGSEGSGVSIGEGVREGPAPQKEGKISSQCPTKAETTWERTRRTN
jgi:hypothetical protein